MENKKPQSAPAPAKTPAQSASAKSTQPAPIKVAQPKETASAKSTQPTPIKEAQPKETAQAKLSQPAPAKAAQPKETAQAKLSQTAPAKAAQPKETAQAKLSQPTPAKAAQPKETAPTKPSQPTPAKAAQPTQKKPSVDGKMVSVKEPAVAKPQSPVAKASTSKQPIAQASVTKTPDPSKEASAPQSSPKIASPVKTVPLPKPSSESKPDSSPKAAVAEKPAQSEPIKATEPKQPTVKKDTPKSVLSKKLSDFSKLATKGFVIKSWQIAIAVVAVVALVVGGVLLGTVLNNKDADDPIVDYTGPLVNKNPDALGNIALPGYGGIKFPANSKKVTLELPNPMGNPCYFRYTLALVETDEVLYTSELIAPGKMVKELTLNRALPKGTYTLRIIIDTFSLADGTTPMNGGVQEVALTVK